MPIFEYVCEDCGNKFEKLVRGSNGAAGEGVQCPSCGQSHLATQFSTFAAHANAAAKKEAAMPSCAPGSCRTPHICGMN